MDISDWTIPRIMQLPDYLFGRRFVVSCCGYSVAAAPAWDIAEIPFPEHFVLWGTNMFSSFLDTNLGTCRLALGDQLPTSTAMMDRLEPLIPGLGFQGAEPRYIYPHYVTTFGTPMIKQAYSAAGRRFILELTAKAAQNARLTVMLMVSSMPREIPDWFFGRQV